MIPKFRVWHLKEKKMYDIHSIDWDIAFNIKYVWIVTDYGDYIRLDSKDIILLQSIGFFDKNKKEIFEGDIVIDHEISPSLENKRVIRNLIEDTYWLLQNIRENSINMFEVIGNIYENPELLKEEK